MGSGSLGEESVDCRDGPSIRARRDRQQPAVLALQQAPEDRMATCPAGIDERVSGATTGGAGSEKARDGVCPVVAMWRRGASTARHRRSRGRRLRARRHGRRPQPASPQDPPPLAWARDPSGEASPHGLSAAGPSWRRPNYPACLRPRPGGSREHRTTRVPQSVVGEGTAAHQRTPTRCQIVRPACPPARVDHAGRARSTSRPPGSLASAGRMGARGPWAVDERRLGWR